LTLSGEERGDSKEDHSCEGLRVYCSGPIRGDISYVENYHYLIRKVEELGAVALTERTIGQDPGEERPDTDDDMGIYLRDMEWLKSSQCVVAEVSAPSLGAGFEISYALFVMAVPVLAFHSMQGRRLSAMIEGCDLENLKVVHYNRIEEIEHTLSGFLHHVQKEK